MASVDSRRSPGGRRPSSPGRTTPARTWSVASTAMAGPGRGTAEAWRRPSAGSGPTRSPPTRCSPSPLTVLAAGRPRQRRRSSTPPTRSATRAWWTPLLVVAATLAADVPAAPPDRRAGGRRRRPRSPASCCDIVGPSWLALLVAIYSVGAHTEGRPRLRAIVGVGVRRRPSCSSLGVVGDEVTLVDAIAVDRACSRRRSCSATTCAGAASTSSRSPTGPSGPSGSGSSSPASGSPRSGRASPASCTTSSPTRSA